MTPNIDQALRDIESRLASAESNAMSLADSIGEFVQVVRQSLVLGGCIIRLEVTVVDPGAVPVGGATVGVYDGSNTLITYGTTDTSGFVTLTLNAPGTYRVQFSDTGHVTHSGTITVSCGDIRIWTETIYPGIQLFGCAAWYPSTLNLVDTANAVTASMVWDSGTSTLKGCTTINTSSGRGCTGVAGTPVWYTIDSSGNLSVAYKTVSGCPVAGTCGDTPNANEQWVLAGTSFTLIPYFTLNCGSSSGDTIAFWDYNSSGYTFSPVNKISSSTYSLQVP